MTHCETPNHTLRVNQSQIHSGVMMTRERAMTASQSRSSHGGTRKHTILSQESRRHGR